MDWRFKVVVVLVVATVITSVTWIYYQEDEEKPPIKIGVIVPLTGISSHLSRVRDGLKLAVEEINNDGGVHGRRIQLVIEDSKGDPEVAVKAFERNEAKAEPIAYISVLSSVTEALAPLAERAEVMMIGLHVTQENISKDRKWIFRLSINACDQAHSLVSILESLYIMDPAIIYYNASAPSSIAHMVEEEVEDMGGTYLDVPFEETSPDYASILRNATSREAIVTIGFASHVTGLVQAAREVNFTGHIIAPSVVSTPDNVEGGSLDGVYVSAPIIYNPAYKFADDAKSRFSKKFNEPMTHQSAGGYDIMNIIANLLRNVRPDRESLRVEFDLGFHHSGLLGSLFLDSCCDAIPIPLYQAQVENGTLVYK